MNFRPLTFFFFLNQPLGTSELNTFLAESTSNVNCPWVPCHHFSCARARGVAGVYSSCAWVNVGVTPWTCHLLIAVTKSPSALTFAHTLAICLLCSFYEVPKCLERICKLQHRKLESNLQLSRFKAPAQPTFDRVCTNMHAQIEAWSSWKTTPFEWEVLNAQLRAGSFGPLSGISYINAGMTISTLIHFVSPPSPAHISAGFSFFCKCHSLVQQQDKCKVKRSLKIIFGDLSCVSLPNYINVKMSFSLSFSLFFKLLCSLTHESGESERLQSP